MLVLIVIETVVVFCRLQLSVTVCCYIMHCIRSYHIVLSYILPHLVVNVEEQCYHYCGVTSYYIIISYFVLFNVLIFLYLCLRFFFRPTALHHTLFSYSLYTLLFYKIRFNVMSHIQFPLFILIYLGISSSSGPII